LETLGTWVSSLPSRASSLPVHNCCCTSGSISIDQSMSLTHNSSHHNGNGSNNHANKSAAAPSLNVYKKVAVIRHSSDSLTYDDIEGNQKSVTIQELGDAISSAVRFCSISIACSCLRLFLWILKRRSLLVRTSFFSGFLVPPPPFMQTPLQIPRPKLDIPVPRINNVENYERDIPSNYEIQRAYVRYHRLTDPEWFESSDYIADAEDEEWLAGRVTPEANPATKSGRATPSWNKPISVVQRSLPLKLFEQMMDLLEKATGFEIIISTEQAETMFRSNVPKLFHLFPARRDESTKATIGEIIQQVYNYWVQKRSRLRRPLLRRYWPVTSTDDTNPHMVFRPREKEKYKLRKKRQNDANAYRKMKQLRDDFDNLRAVIDLVRKREELYRAHVQLQVQLFHQRLDDVVDTKSPYFYRRDKEETVTKEQVEQVLDVPKHFDIQFGGRKRARPVITNKDHHTLGILLSPAAASTSSFLNDNKRDHPNAMQPGAATPANIAGRNHGEPAPNFLHPLQTRECFVTSWEGAVPYVATYENAQAESTVRFRHRPRVGRGGRICIDRLPMPASTSSIPPITIFRAGRGLKRSLEPKERLLDLLPKPLDKSSLSRRIEGLAIAAIKEDHEIRAMATGMGDADENDGEEVIVKLDDWLDTDDQVFGEERYAIGPI
jgi:enhancer of polycomb-like protein